MNIKSDRGAFTLLFVLFAVLFVEFLLLKVHKNIDSFVRMERNQKKTLSIKKIERIITDSLKNYTACSNTFRKTNQDVKLIKNPLGQQVFDLSVGIMDFYKKSGFYEKNRAKIHKIKIIEDNPENFQDLKPDKVSSQPMISYEYPPGSGILHNMATLQMVFLEGNQPPFSLYAPIYVQTKSGRVQSCSTSKNALGKMACEGQNANVICCRYKYNLTLTPPSSGVFSVGQVYQAEASPGEPAQIGFVKTAEDPFGLELTTDCIDGVDQIKAKLTGFCSFTNSWILETSCYN